MRQVWASSALLGLLVFGQALADGTFCWDQVAGAGFYHLYSAEVDWYSETDPDTGEVRWLTLPPVWYACERQSFSSDNCAAGACCVFVVDRPADLVYYFVTANEGTVNNGGHLPVEPCP